MERGPEPQKDATSTGRRASSLSNSRWVIPAVTVVSILVVLVSGIGISPQTAAVAVAFIALKQLLPYRFLKKAISRILSLRLFTRIANVLGSNGEEHIGTNNSAEETGQRAHEMVSDGGVTSRVRPDPELPTFANIGGYDDLSEHLRKQHIRSRHSALSNDDPEVLSDIPNRILFTGPSGTGKTLFARAFAGELGWQVTHVSMSEIRKESVNESVAELRDILVTAGAHTPHVVILDSLDVFYQDDIPQGVQESFTNLLERELLKLDDNVVVVGTLRLSEERPNILDRVFTDEYWIGQPDPDNRRAILQLYLQEAGHGLADQQLGHVVSWTYEFGAGHLEQLVEQARGKATARGADRVGFYDLEQAYLEMTSR